jgi:hypothetical protein
LSTSPIDAHCEGHGRCNAQPGDTGWDETGQSKQGCDEDTYCTKGIKAKKEPAICHPESIPHLQTINDINVKPANMFKCRTFVVISILAANKFQNQFWDKEVGAAHYVGHREIVFQRKMHEQ